MGAGATGSERFWGGKVVDFVALAGPAATIIAAGAAVLVTWRIGKGQLAVARQQAETARQQAIIAKQQSDTALDRLKYDLFEKRYRVYASAQELLSITILRRREPLYMEEARSRILVMEESRFFFPFDICNYLDLIREKCLSLYDLHVKVPGQNIAHADLPEMAQHIVGREQELFELREGMPAEFQSVLSFAQLIQPVSPI